MQLPELDNDRQYAAFAGLARNRATPLPGLLKLVQHVPSAVLRGLDGRRERIPDELVEALIEVYPGEISRLEGDDRVSPTMRKRLADNVSPRRRKADRKKVRWHIATNNYLHLPLNMLERLVGSTGPAAWAELAVHSDWEVRRALASICVEAPENIRRALLIDPQPEVRAAACWRWRPAPGDLLHLLLADPATRPSVAQYMALTPELAAELARDRDRHVRLALTSNPSLPGSILEELAEDEDGYVRASVAKHPNLPAAVCEEFAAGVEPNLWINLMRNQSTPEPLSSRLYERLAEAAAPAEGDRRAQEAWRDLHRGDVPSPWKLPLERALTHLGSPHVLLRRALAMRNDLPADAIAQLDRDADIEVRAWVARRPNAPLDMLERLVDDCVAEGQASPAMLHPAFPKGPLGRFASAPEPGLRAIACSDPNLPSDVVARLASDDDPYVRARAARHPNLPPDDAVRLLGAAETHVVEAAAGSPALPPGAIEHVLSYAAQHHPIPSLLEEFLTHACTPDVRKLLLREIDALSAGASEAAAEPLVLPPAAVSDPKVLGDFIRDMLNTSRPGIASSERRFQFGRFVVILAATGSKGTATITEVPGTHSGAETMSMQDFADELEP